MSFFQSPFNPVNFALAEDKARNISSIDPKLSRTNYYDGRLLKASDLIRDQLYLDERLREAGRVIGQGIIRGLDVQLTDEGMLLVTPGLAIAPSGRILELEKETLEINLYDPAKMAELNPGFRYLERGLYAVVLEYAEKGEGSAEIYPRDLEAERGFHFNFYAEGVVLTLQALPTRYVYTTKSSGQRLHSSVVSRAALVRDFIMTQRTQPPELPENGIALGLLAIENGKPQWLDRGLLRRQHRPAQSRYNLQMDLFYHYEELLQDVLKLRQQSTREDPFPATHYFDLLPPFGSIPKRCVDPVNGYQGYFPEGFEVSIAPVRRDDINAIVEQSKALEPIDLQKDTDVDIVILVPLSDQEFSVRARQLQHTRLLSDSVPDSDSERDFVHPPHLDDYGLRAYGETTHEENTDSAIWNALWAGDNNIFYVRRPTRVAETQVSAIVLAAGRYEDLPDINAELPQDVEELEARIDELEEDNEALLLELNRDPDERLDEARAIIEDLNEQIEELEDALEAAESGDDQTAGLRERISQLEEENKKILEEQDALEKKLAEAEQRIKELESGNGGQSMSIEEILKRRPVNDDAARKAAQEIHENFADSPRTLATIVDALLVMPARYDALNWPTLAAVANQKQLPDLLTLFEKNPDTSLPQLMAKTGEQFKLDEKIIDQWKKLAESE